MAIIYWRLGHLMRNGQSQPQDSYIVRRGNSVYDADTVGWGKGVRPGMALQEMKWRYPEAAIISWRQEDYQQAYSEICEWLKGHAEFYSQKDVQSGYWSYPGMDFGQWRRLVTDILPRWASRTVMGIAPHPLLAEWMSQEGAQYPDLAEHWAQEYHEAYAVLTDKIEILWKTLPLRYLPEALPGHSAKDWKKRGWVRVGDVPNLYSILSQRHFVMPDVENERVIHVEKRFDTPVHQGLPELIRVMAGEIAQTLHNQRQGSRQLRIVWESEQGDEIRERTWPVQTESPQQVVTRFLTLLSALPQAPPERVVIEARQLDSVKAGQLTWWAAPVERRAHSLPEWEVPVSRRDKLLQYWDPWRAGQPH